MSTLYERENMDNKIFTLRRRVNMLLIVIMLISVMTTLFTSNQYAIAQYSHLFSIPSGLPAITDPRDIVIDKNGNIFIALKVNVVKLDNAGATVMVFGSSGSGDGQFVNIVDIALDSKGNIYVADSFDDRVQKFDSEGNFILKFGYRGSGDGQFVQPNGIALDSVGNIYVVESGNDRVQKFDSEGNFISKFGSEGIKNGQFVNPKDIELDSNDNIYVVESDRVQKFDSQGSFLVSLGSSGFGLFYGLTDIALDSNDNIYVVERDRVQKFDSQGNFLVNFGSLSSGNGQFVFLTGIALDSSDNIYVVEVRSASMQKFNAQGLLLAKFGLRGSGDGLFAFPKGIALDSSGNIYVSDRGNDRVQKFDFQGNFLAKFGSNGTGIAFDSSDNIYVSVVGVQKFDSEGNFILKFGSRGSGDGQFISPQEIALDNDDNIFVVDKLNHRIQKFDLDGDFISKFGSLGSGDGQFDSPEGIALDSVDNIYVVDLGNHRIQKFDSKGNFILKFGSEGVKDGQFISPNGIAVDNFGKIYVADTYNHRIQVFKPELVIDKDFSDIVSGGTTSGTIIDSGDQELTITDEPNPTGIRIAADSSSGPKHATVGACGNNTTINLDAGDEIVVTCDSADSSTNIDVINGIVEAIFTMPDGLFTAISVLGQDNGIAFEPDTFRLTAPSSNTEAVAVVVIIETNGKWSLLSISPGQTLELIVNDLVAKEYDPVTSFNSNPSSNAPAGTFTIIATFTNTSSKTIKYPFFLVSKLSGGNLLLNADDPPGGVGAILTPDVDNDALLPGESMTVDFIIGLQDDSEFTFITDLLGVPES